MTEALEVGLGGMIASFDGRVLEVFSTTDQGSARYHVRQIRSIEVDAPLVKVQLPDGLAMWGPFRDDQRSGLDQLVAAVTAAAS